MLSHENLVADAAGSSMMFKAEEGMYGSLIWHHRLSMDLDRMSDSFCAQLWALGTAAAAQIGLRFDAT